jgi:drug/metabolite transporter (DMT)-like permease
MAIWMVQLTINPSGVIQSRLPFHPAIALVSGVLAISTGAVFAKLADAPSLVIAAYRVGIASLILIPLAWWKAQDELVRLSLKDIILAFVSGFFLALHFAAWISSLSFTSVTNSVVLVNTNPLWVGLLTPLINKEKIKTTAAVSIFISILGGIIIGAEDFSIGAEALFGDFLALMGGICAAFYLLLGRNLRKKVSLIPYISVCYGSAAIVLWMLVLGFGLKFYGFSGQTITAFWAMALIPQLIGHTSYNWALKWFSASTIAVSLLGEPIGATILAYFIFNEKLTWSKLIGGALILSAICITAYGEKPATLSISHQSNL